MFKRISWENLSLSPSAKDFWQSVNIWGSYRQEFSGLVFFDSRFRSVSSMRGVDWFKLSPAGGGQGPETLNHARLMSSPGTLIASLNDLLSVGKDPSVSGDLRPIDSTARPPVSIKRERTHGRPWSLPQPIVSRFLPLLRPVETTIRIIYESLFTENSVATQKQYSTSVNTNKIQYKIHSSWHLELYNHHSSPNLILYYLIIIIIIIIIMGSRGGRQKLILEIIALMVNHPSGILLLYTPAAVYCILQPAIGRGVVNKHWWTANWTLYSKNKKKLNLTVKIFA